MTLAADEDPWLSDEQQQVWRVFLAVQALLPASLDAQLTRKAGMSHSSYIVLALLSEAPDRSLRMSELAEAVTMSPSRVSHAVARLEERGLVRREKASDDGRGNRAILTVRGYDVLTAAAPGHAAAVRRLVFGGLTPEQLQQFGEILAVIEDRLRTDESTRVAPSRGRRSRPVA
jgi:DNA-binding MarR family transcriptional regulator